MNTLNHLLLVHECAKYNFLHFQWGQIYYQYFTNKSSKASSTQNYELFLACKAIVFTTFTEEC